MRKSIVAVLLIMIATIPRMGVSQSNHSVPVPKDGFVPSAATAVTIAEAVLIPIYGRENIRSQKPFEVKKTGEKWIVNGTRRKGWVGGIATIEIARTDGRILRVSHSK